MILKKTFSTLTAIVFTIATIGCSSNIETKEAAGSGSMSNTGASQVSGSSQQNSFALRVIMAIVIGAIVSKVVKDKTEDTIDDTIKDIINGN